MEYEELKKELASISKVIESFPENLKSKVFEILMDSYLNGKTTFNVPKTDSSKSKAVEAEVPPKEKESKKASLRKATKESYNIDRDLNLRGDTSTPSFKSFFEEKKPSSKGEFNVLATYYLSKIMGIELVTINHVYTCYAEVKFKPAENFKQSFIDTKNKFGYIEYDKNWNLNIPHRGIVFIEHDLPKKVLSKK
jgi:hypothetical protein